MTHAPQAIPDREAAPSPLELRFEIGPAEAPLAYPVIGWPEQPVAELEVEMVGPGVLANLIVLLAGPRAWAGELFSAVSVAHREATGDPHALTDAELAELPDPEADTPGPGVVVRGQDDGTPARVRICLAVEIQDECLSTVELRATLIEHLAERFNIARVGVSAGDIVAGRP